MLPFPEWFPVQSKALCPGGFPLSTLPFYEGIPSMVRRRTLSTPPFSERYPTSAYAAHQDMKFVRNLLRLRGAFLGCGCILSSSVAADDIYFGVGQQPSGECFLLAIWNYEGFPLVILENRRGIERKTLIIV